MKILPPRWVRRLILAPLVFVGALCLVVLSPLIHLIAVMIDVAVDRGRWRVSRFVGIGLAFCVVEVFGLFALLTVWIGSGFGLFMARPFWVRANTILVGQYLELITRAIRFYLGFAFSCTWDAIPPGPQLLFSRHAGPGDAFLIARVIIRDLGRRIHMVGAAKLQWDPFLDISGERLGFHYLASNPTDRKAELERIRILASELERDATLVIFPEGGNYTAERQARSLEVLHARGLSEHARRAEQLKHTLLPRAGGVTSAINGSPDAAVVFMAHAGLEDLSGFGDLWASVPLRQSVVANTWTVPTDRWPSHQAGQEAWLFDHWLIVDEWIESTINRPNR